MNGRLKRERAAIVWCLVTVTILVTQVAHAEWYQEVRIGKIYGDITCVTRYHGDLVAGGFFTRIKPNDVASIARWDGKEWMPMGSGFTFQGGTAWIRDLIVFGDKLIAAGTFDMAGGVATSGIAVWDGNQWHDMDGGIGPSFSGGNPDVKALLIYDGSLIAGGNFTEIGAVTTNNVGRWDGAVWHKLGSGTPQIVHCLAEFQGNLYAGGATTHPDPVIGNAVWTWTGSNWYSTTIEGVGIGVLALTEYNGYLVAGGVFFASGGGLAIKYGNQWYEYGDGVSWNAEIYDLDVIDGDLIVSGDFDYVGEPSHDASGVARFDGANWHDLDYGVWSWNSWSRVYQVVPDGDGFLAAGVFNRGGTYPGTSMATLANWKEIDINLKSVSALQIPQVPLGAWWNFSWKTSEYGDPMLDQVVVRDCAGTAPSCMIGAETFMHNGSTVIAEVTELPDGQWLHAMSVDRRDCAPGCDYKFDVSSTAWGYTVSATDRAWNTGYCIMEVEPPIRFTDAADVVARTELKQNHPNPFNPSTVIGYSIAEDSKVTLAVYDVSGKLVRTLVNEHQGKNRYDVTWDGRDNAGAPVASGTYFYRLQTPTYNETRKLLLLK